jgi:hypothetical protein
MKNFSKNGNPPKKTQKRVSIMQEAPDFANQKASEDFGMTSRSFSMEISKLILIAKETLEKPE